MTTERYDTSAIHLGGFLYVIGGVDGLGNRLRTAERYCPASNSWTAVMPMSMKRKAAAVAVVDGFIYACGGVDKHDPNTVERYDPSSDLWQALAPMHTRRLYAAAAALGGYVYVFGGSYGGMEHASVERYDPDTNVWSLVGELPQRWEGVRAAVVGEWVYVVCGSLFKFSPRTNKWVRVASLPGRRFEEVVALDGKVYMVGGRSSVDESILGRVERFCALEGSWEELASMSIEREGFGIAGTITRRSALDCMAVR
jgi:N-acetylneuraminic acid mutarotase